MEIEAKEINVVETEAMETAATDKPDMDTNKEIEAVEVNVVKTEPMETKTTDKPEMDTNKESEAVEVNIVKTEPMETSCKDEPVDATHIIATNADERTTDHAVESVSEMADSLAKKEVNTAGLTDQEQSSLVKEDVYLLTQDGSQFVKASETIIFEMSSSGTITFCSDNPVMIQASNVRWIKVNKESEKIMMHIIISFYEQREIKCIIFQPLKLTSVLETCLSGMIDKKYLGLSKSSGEEIKHKPQTMRSQDQDAISMVRQLPFFAGFIQTSCEIKNAQNQQPHEQPQFVTIDLEALCVYEDIAQTPLVKLMFWSTTSPLSVDIVRYIKFEHRFIFASETADVALIFGPEDFLSEEDLRSKFHILSSRQPDVLNNISELASIWSGMRETRHEPAQRPINLGPSRRPHAAEGVDVSSRVSPWLYDSGNEDQPRHGGAQRSEVGQGHGSLQLPARHAFEEVDYIRAKVNSIEAQIENAERTFNTSEEMMNMWITMETDLQGFIQDGVVPSTDLRSGGLDQNNVDHFVKSLDDIADLLTDLQLSIAVSRAQVCKQFFSTSNQAAIRDFVSVDEITLLRRLYIRSLFA